MDFVSDVLTNERRIRVLNIIADFYLEIIAWKLALLSRQKEF